MPEMREINFTGDTRTTWDAHNESEVKAAKENFDRLKKKGFSAFYVKQDGTPGKPMKDFDEHAEKSILIPQLAGGR